MLFLGKIILGHVALRGRMGALDFAQITAVEGSGSAHTGGRWPRFQARRAAVRAPNRLEDVVESSYAIHNDGTNGRSLGNQIAPETDFVNSPMVRAYIATASHTSACPSFGGGADSHFLLTQGDGCWGNSVLAINRLGHHGDLMNCQGDENE
jgi:hypothetical protein